MKPNEFRNMMLAAALGILFFMGYTHYIKSKYPDLAAPRSSSSSTPAPSQTTAPAGQTKTGDSAASSAGALPTLTPVDQVEPEVALLSEQDLRFEKSEMILTFNQQSGSPSSILLKKYRDAYHPDAPMLNIAPRGVVLQARPDDGGMYEVVQGYQATREGNKIHFERRYGQFKVTQTFIMPESGYLGDFSLKFVNVGSATENLNLKLVMRESLVYPKEEGMVIPIPGAATHRPMFVSNVNNSQHWDDIKGACKDAKFFPAPPTRDGDGLEGTLQVIGFDIHHFLTALLPTTNPFTYKMGVYEAPSDDSSCPVALTLSQPMGPLNPGEEVVTSFKTYFGPKDNEIMDASHKALSETIDFGFFSFLAVPLLNAIKFFQHYTGNFGIAIIIVTLILKLLFYPLQKQASISGHQMKKLQPQMTKLRERYKDDPRKQQQELLKFMSTNKINPMKGCIPILPTIPVFFAFFRVLSSSIDLRHAPFFAWVHDLSAPDPFYVTPILLTGAMFLQQKMTPMTGMDKTQQKVMLFMPLIFGVMMLTLPSGMTIYMLTNTVVSIGQMKWINHQLEKMDQKKLETKKPARLDEERKNS